MTIESDQLAANLAVNELKLARVDLNSPAGLESLLRVSAFGIMGAQPPNPELNQPPATKPRWIPTSLFGSRR